MKRGWIGLLAAGCLLALGGLGLRQVEAVTGNGGDVHLSTPQPVAPGELEEYPDVAVDGKGQAWVSWIGVIDGVEHVFVRSYRGTEGSPPLDIGLDHGLQFSPRVIASGDHVWVVWSICRGDRATEQDPWQLVVREIVDGAPGSLEVLSSPSEDAIRPALGLDAHGEPWVAWESRVGSRFRVMARPLTPTGLQPRAIEVSTGGELNLRPAVTAAPRGGVYVLWDQYAEGEYQILARRIDGRLYFPPLRISDEPAVNVAPSAVTDAEGRVFIAYDTNADGRGGQRPGKELRLKVLADGTVRELAGGAPFRIQTAPGRRDAIEFPTVGLDPAGRVWLFARRGQGFIAFCYEGSRWQKPIDLSGRGWGGRGRELRAAWSSDGFHLVSRQLHTLAHQLLVPASSPPRALALKPYEGQPPVEGPGMPVDAAAIPDQASASTVASAGAASPAGQTGRAVVPATAGPAATEALQVSPDGSPLSGSNAASSTSEAPPARNGSAVMAAGEPATAPSTMGSLARLQEDLAAIIFASITPSAKAVRSATKAASPAAGRATGSGGNVSSRAAVPVSAVPVDNDPTEAGLLSQDPAVTPDSSQLPGDSALPAGATAVGSPEGSSATAAVGTSRDSSTDRLPNTPGPERSAPPSDMDDGQDASPAANQSRTQDTAPGAPLAAAMGKTGTAPSRRPAAHNTSSAGAGPDNTERESAELRARTLVLADGVGAPRPALPSVQYPGSVNPEDGPLPLRREPGLYFGDLHTHTWMSDGSGDPDEIYTRSRDRYRFDFVAVTDHDLENGNQLLPSEWAYLKLMAAVFNAPNQFVTFVAYEWTSLSYPRGAGHRNVYYPGADGPLFNCAGEASESRSLFELLKGTGALAVPHHIGWTGTDWENHDPEIQRAVEIVSVHGAFEKPGNQPVPPRHELAGMFVRDGLLRGLKFGLVAGSDGHGFPWHYGVSRKEDVWRTGLTGIQAPALNRNSLHAALMSRQSIATSGAAIAVSFTVNGKPMGSELHLDRGPRFDILVKGTAPLKDVVLVRDGEDIQRFPGKGSSLEASASDEPSPGDHFYYLRAVQVNGEVAWASPVWVELKGRILVGPPDP